MKSLLGLQLGSPSYPKVRSERSTITKAAFIAVLAAFMTLPLWAQRPRLGPAMPVGPGITVHGMVTQGDRPVSGASIELQEIASGATANTVAMADGSFEFRNVAPGEYILIVNVGPDQVRSEVSLSGLMPELHIRMPGAAAQSTNTAAAVSVQQLQVPEKARKAFEDAQKAAQRGDVQKSMDKVQQALIFSPGYGQALALRATLHLADGDIAAAINDAETAVHSDPGYSPSFFVLASALNRASKFVDAGHAAQEGLRLDPRAWQGHFELGAAMAGLNQFDPALNEFNAAADAAPPTFPGVHLLRAVTLMKLQRYGDAKKDLEEVIRREPNGPDAQRAQQLLPQVKRSAPTQ